MDGMHDLGGKQGFWKINYPATPHDETWEPLVRALSGLAVKKHIYNMDEYRHAIERMLPVHYLSAPYYERELTAAATLLVEKGVITAEELSAQVDGTFPLSRPIGPGRQNAPAQTFEIGETVRVRNEFVSGHVRMPGYIRGKQGVIVAKSPPYPFPDAAAHNMQVTEEPTYDVRFHSEELWPGSSDEAFIHVGVFQSYLEPCGLRGKSVP
jgi:nitrile hydratase subunit beta